MSLLPDLNEQIARARSDMRMGLPVVLRGPQRMVLAVPTETVSAVRLADLRDLGPVDLAITTRRADTLKARAYDGELARVVLPSDADLRWVQSVADPADDLRSPMKGPLNSQRQGDAALHRVAIDLCKSARLLPAALVVETTLPHPELTALPAEAVAGLLTAEVALHPIVRANVPLRASKAAKLHIFRPDDGGEEHYAVEIGQPDRSKPVLARLHSACFTGDLLGSLKCDCGPQLNAALNQMGHEGEGILLYLNQEGRGIGLANKMRAYALQDQGFDTVEANHRLGFEDDERDFRLGAQILQRMGVEAVRLMTNNPGKIDMMQACGITVSERVPLKVGETDENAHYLAIKAAKSGHLL